MKRSYYSPKSKELADELGIEVQRIYKWRKAVETVILPKPEKTNIRCALALKRLRKALKQKEFDLSKPPLWLYKNSRAAKT
ncbi:hypothetical protein [Zunongwangia sp.]|uniref:hypothetical protein n=1 Tax=Zunongwangia sp. TaxID=1965325 RepID=UPI003AA9A54A